MYGNDGADHLYGGSQTDYLHGQDDDDTLDGGAGDDFLHGGLGADTFIGSAGADLNDAGSGLDRDLVDYSGSPAGVVVDLTTASGSEATARGIGGFAEGDRLLGSIEDVTGSAFDDRITGDFRSNALLGGGGATTCGALKATTCSSAEPAPINSTVATASAAPILCRTKGAAPACGSIWPEAGAGAATPRATSSRVIEDITGSSHKDTLFGDGGNNTLDGAFGSDELHGREGVDILMGGAHDDRLWGDAGADHLWGGSGSDTFMFAGVSDSPFSARGASATFDTIHDFVSGSDQIDLSAIDAIHGHRGCRGQPDVQSRSHVNVHRRRSTPDQYLQQRDLGSARRDHRRRRRRPHDRGHWPRGRVRIRYHRCDEGPPPGPAPINGSWSASCFNRTGCAPHMILRQAQSPFRPHAEERARAGVRASRSMGRPRSCGTGLPRYRRPFFACG